MRKALVVLWMLLCSVTAASAQVSVGVWLPGVSIGINMPVYPTMVVVPGYPVYYAPQINANYFFYDGMYWVFVGDSWYASSWYNGPWVLVEPVLVPVFILRVPVYYYRQPPVYFRAWNPQAPPRWGEHWGSGWEQRRSGWDNWNRGSVPAPAPLPAYQRQYEGNRYPRVEEQQTLQRQHYRYEPRDAVVKQHYQAHRTQSAAESAPKGAKGAREEKGAATQERSSSGRSATEQSAPPPRGQAPQAGVAQREPQPRTQSQDKGPPQDRGSGKDSRQDPAAQQSAPPPRGQAPQKGGGEYKGGGGNQRSAPAQAPSRPVTPPAEYQSQQPHPSAAQREQQPRSQSQDRGPPPDKGSGKDSRQDEGKGK